MEQGRPEDRAEELVNPLVVIPLAFLRLAVHRVKYAAVSFDTDGIGGEPVPWRQKILDTGPLSLAEIRRDIEERQQPKL